MVIIISSDYKYFNYDSDYNVIKNSGLFDEKWYLKKYSLDSEIDLIKHFLDHSYEYLNPTPYFDMRWYLQNNIDVKKSNMNPFVHYINYGMSERRFPCFFSFDKKYFDDYFIIINSGLFDWVWFQNFYLLDEDVNPILYYLKYCVKYGLNPSPNFDTLWYLKQYPDVEKEGYNPFVHYIKYGKKAGFLSKIYDFDEIPQCNLKKSIRGKFNYLFLINDSSNELKQHFDSKYSNRFDFISFTRDYFFKKYFFEKNNFSYFYFVVPDKSVICKNLVPFDTDFLKRNIDFLDFIPDFSEDLDEFCYWQNDSHMNFKGAEKLSFKILNYIDKTFDIDNYNDYIKNCDINQCDDPSDLLFEINWSYPQKDKEDFNISTLNFYIPKHLKSLDIPNKFSKCKSRLSEHYFNEDSFSNLKVLIFRDSSTTNLKYYLSTFFREMFLYWDHGELNNELIEWYNPDIIIEIRIERFLEGYSTPNDIKDVMWW